MVISMAVTSLGPSAVSLRFLWWFCSSISSCSRGSVKHGVEAKGGKGILVG